MTVMGRCGLSDIKNDVKMDIQIEGLKHRLNRIHDRFQDEEVYINSGRKIYGNYNANLQDQAGVLLQDAIKAADVGKFVWATVLALVTWEVVKRIQGVMKLVGGNLATKETAQPRLHARDWRWQQP